MDLDTKKVFEENYCTCAALFGIQAWCETWLGGDESLCVLNGGAMSRFCPRTWQVTISGRLVDAYLSSDLLICKKAERKSFIY